MSESTFEKLNNAIFQNQFLMTTEELDELILTINSIKDARN